MQDSIQEVVNKFKKLEHMNSLEIGYKIGLNINLLSNKLSISTLVNQMFKYFHIDLPKLKNDFNIAVKTVRLKENGIPKESMSFEQINFNEIINEDWDNSFLKNKFKNTTFLFIVFEYLGDNLYFKGIKLWKMPEIILDSNLKSFWLSLKSKLETGVTLKKVNKGTKIITENDLPSSKQSNIMHVRPKAKNAQDTVELPDGQFITKQSYWFNNDYVSAILIDMPPLQVKLTSVWENDLQKYDYKMLNPLLTKEIYTITEFIQIAQQVYLNFDDFDVHDIKLNTIGYKIEPPFILRTDIESIDTYFNQKILSERYFKLENNEVWQSSFVKRKLDNMENNYSIFKIEEGLYLTEAALIYASIGKAEIISYRECVEAFVEKNQYFTYNSLKEANFHHPVEVYGFEQLFYESLLKRPGRLKSIKIGGQLFFIKTTSKVDLTHFFQSLFIKQNRSHLSVDDLIEIFENIYFVKLNFEVLDTLLCLNCFGQYYSPKLHRLFNNKTAYLDYIQST